MQITFEISLGSQSITQIEFGDFENFIGKTFPVDYRQHMLTYNGGDVIEPNNAHVSDPDGSSGIEYFHPIKYGGHTIEKVHINRTPILPSGYISIGKTKGGGDIIISLNNDSTYGNIKEWYPDDIINDLSSSFKQLLNDQVEEEEY